MHDGLMTVAPVGPMRSLLFVPAVRPDFIAKLPGRGADAVVIDCEDATPANAKAEARRNARELTPGLVEQGCSVVVRINAVDTEWFGDDVEQALLPSLAAVIVPKVETVEGLDRVAAALTAAGLPNLGVLAGIETALGVADARPVLSHPVVVAAYFGAEDFIADIGGVRTPGNAEVAYARSAVALAARLAKVPLLDQIVSDFRDSKRFTHEAAEARALGYSGKLCIHPNQVELANAAWTPTEAEIDRARRLVAAYEAASSRGIAAIDFEGQMVDEPLATQARRILTLAHE
jgi:citrate lyase subunit beta/citryl-CoA lyase